MYTGDDYTLPSHQDYTVPSSSPDGETTLGPSSSEGQSPRLTKEFPFHPGWSLLGCWRCCCRRGNKKNLLDGVEEEDDSVLVHQRQHRRRLFRLAFIANTFFLLGSAIQILASLYDFQWALSVQKFPIEVLQADDDATWEAYQRSQGKNPAFREGQRNLKDTTWADYYSTLDWMDLPYDIKHALVTLGQSQPTWTGDYKSQLNQTTWADLTYEQQEAAQWLGLDEYTWDAPTTEPPMPEWDDYHWDDLSSPQQEAWSVLGYNGDMWDHGILADTEYLVWSQLTQEQRDAASSLGYDRAIWNSDEVVDERTPAPTEEGLEPFDEQEEKEEEDYHYKEETSAPDDEPLEDPSASNATEAVANLMDEPSRPQETDATPDAPVNNDEDEEEVQEQVSAPDSPADWKEIQWNYLPAHIREAFESLGYNEELWRTKESPFSESLYWDELTAEQRDNATMLGYTREAWDQVRNEKHQTYKEQLAQAEASITSSETTPETASPSKVPTPSPTSKAPTSPLPTSPHKDKPKPTAATKPPTSQPTSQPTPKPTRKPTPAPTKDPYSDVEYNDDLVIVPRSEYFDDDIVMSVGYSDISLTQVLTVVASLCFLVVGWMNWIRDEQVFHVCMVQGALSMMLSAACKGYSDVGAIIFQALAYHCYLLEGIYMLRLRKSIQALYGLETLSYGLWLADSLFAAGSVVGVVLGYWQFMDVDAEFDLNLAAGKLFSACLWIVASAICFLSTVVLAMKRIDRYNDRYGRIHHVRNQGESFL